MQVPGGLDGRRAVAFSRTQDALIFGGFAAVALLVGAVLLYRRDTN